MREGPIEEDVMARYVANQQLAEAERARQDAEALNEEELTRLFTECEDLRQETRRAHRAQRFIGRLTQEGATEVAHICGLGRFLETFERVTTEASKNSEQSVSMYDVICEIEPDRRARLELYKKMEVVAEKEFTRVNVLRHSLGDAGESSEEVARQEWKYWRYEGAYEFGSSGNATQLKKDQIATFRYFDSLADLPARALERIKGAALQRTTLRDRINWFRDFQGIGGWLDKHSEIEKMRGELEASAGDFYEVVVRKAIDVENLKGLWLREQTKAVGLHQQAINAITSQEVSVFNTERNRLLGDLAKIRNLSLSTSPGNESIDIAVINFEEHIRESEEATARRIEERTATLRHQLAQMQRPNVS